MALLFVFVLVLVLGGLEEIGWRRVRGGMGEQVGSFDEGRAEGEERGFLGDAFLDVDAAGEGWARGYAGALASAGADDLGDLHKLGFLRSLGRDARGRPAFVVIGKLLPAAAFGGAADAAGAAGRGRWAGWGRVAPGEDAAVGGAGGAEAERGRERLVRYFARRLHRAAAEGPYTVLYVHSECRGGALSALAPGLAGWAWRVYAMLPPFYTANLARLVVLHPTLALRVNLGMWGPLVAPRVWAKTSYVHRIEWLAPSIFSRAAIAAQLPPWVREHDALLEAQPLLDYGFYSASADSAAGLALGAIGFSGAPLVDAGRADPASQFAVSLAKATMGFAG